MALPAARINTIGWKPNFADSYDWYPTADLPKKYIAQGGAPQIAAGGRTGPNCLACPSGAWVAAPGEWYCPGDLQTANGTVSQANLRAAWYWTAAVDLGATPEDAPLCEVGYIQDAGQPFTRLAWCWVHADGSVSLRSGTTELARSIPGLLQWGAGTWNTLAVWWKLDGSNLPVTTLVSPSPTFNALGDGDGALWVNGRHACRVPPPARVSEQPALVANCLRWGAFGANARRFDDVLIALGTGALTDTGTGYADNYLGDVRVYVQRVTGPQQVGTDYSYPPLWDQNGATGARVLTDDPAIGADGDSTGISCAVDYNNDHVRRGFWPVTAPAVAVAAGGGSGTAKLDNVFTGLWALGRAVAGDGGEGAYANFWLGTAPDALHTSGFGAGLGFGTAYDRYRLLWPINPLAIGEQAADTLDAWYNPRCPNPTWLRVDQGWRSHEVHVTNVAVEVAVRPCLTAASAGDAPDAAYLASSYGLFRLARTDAAPVAGEWTELGADLFGTQAVPYVNGQYTGHQAGALSVVSPKGYGKRLYVQTNNSDPRTGLPLFYVTGDGGATWYERKFPVGTSRLLAWAARPHDPDVLTVLMADQWTADETKQHAGLYRSLNAGCGWTFIRRIPYTEALGLADPGGGALWWHEGGARDNPTWPPVAPGPAVLRSSEDGGSTVAADPLPVLQTARARLDASPDDATEVRAWQPGTVSWQYDDALQAYTWKSDGNYGLYVATRDGVTERAAPLGHTAEWRGRGRGREDGAPDYGLVLVTYSTTFPDPSTLWRTYDDGASWYHAGDSTNWKFGTDTGGQYSSPPSSTIPLYDNSYPANDDPWRPKYGQYLAAHPSDPRQFLTLTNGQYANDWSGASGGVCFTRDGVHFRVFVLPYALIATPAWPVSGGWAPKGVLLTEGGGADVPTGPCGGRRLRTWAWVGG